MPRTVKAMSRRTARWSYGLAWVVVAACLTAAFLSALFAEDYVEFAFTLNDLGVLKYVVSVLAAGFLAVLWRAAPRRRDQSRAAGGAGLRFGQGPLPSWQRLDRWLDRWVGTPLGNIAVAGFWFFGAAGSILCVVVVFLYSLLLLTLTMVGAYAGSRLIGDRHWPALFLALLPLGSYLILKVLRRGTRRYPAACMYLVMCRIYAITDRAIGRLVADKPRRSNEERRTIRPSWDP